MTALLEVRDLAVSFADGPGRRVRAVDGVSFDLERGELLAIVGESGCGKSLTGLSIPALLPTGARIEDRASVVFDGIELNGLEVEALRSYRGARIAMVFQDPMASLNPVMTIGAQLVETIRAHRSMPSAEARGIAIELLEEVGIADAATRMDSHAHQLSGGMRQRVMIALALASEPELLIADEPTTALDVTVQAQILELLDHLQRSREMAILLITHDLGIVAGRADHVLVMYGGRIVESAPTARLFGNPRHPYTIGLLESLPSIEERRERLLPIPGVVPPLNDYPAGCTFHPRCRLAIEGCRTERPMLVDLDSDGHRVACPVVSAGGAG